MPVAVSARNLTKIYRDGKVANDSINLEINEGEIFAILGPNGAGKTTFVRQITSELISTSGNINVFGIDIQKEPRRIAPLLGVVPQEIQPYGDLTVYEHVYYLARLRGLSKLRAAQETTRVLSELELSEYRGKLVGTLSGGLKRRAILATALTGDTRLLVLDEPSTGLDPAARRNLWRVIVSNAKRGKTVILTTHYVEEAEAIADRVAIFAKARVIICDKPDNIKSTMTGFIRLKLTSKGDNGGKNLADKTSELHAVGLQDVQLDEEGNLIIHIKSGEKQFLPLIFDWAMRNHLEVNVSQSTLEDAYLDLVK